MLDGIIAFLKCFIFAGGQFVNFADHAEDIDGKRGDARLDIGHTEGLVALEGSFHIRHDLKGFVVGTDQQFKIVIPFFEIETQCFDIGGRRTFFGGRKKIMNACKKAHFSVSVF